MKSKLSILISFVLILTILSPAIVKNVEAEKINNKSLGIFDFLKAESFIGLNYDKSSVEDPLIPGETYKVPINISYIIEGLLAGPYSKILSNSKATIDLSVESGKYYEASIKPESVEANITVDETNIATTPEVSIVVKDNAVAYTELKVKVTAKTGVIKGPIGLLTYVTEANSDVNIPITPAYLPNIEVIPDFNSKEIPPFNVTEIPVNITNNGNGKTKVTIEALNVSEHFNVTFTDSIILEINQTEQVLINVKPDNDFDQETLNVSFTPIYNADSSLKGDSTIQTFTLKNDGSYIEPEEDGFEIDLTLLIIFILVLLIIIVLIYVIRNRF